MEILLLGIYSFFVWVIFFKFKWLPWNIVSQVIVITLPIFALAALILMLNIAAPSSHDVRVINYVVPVVPRVTGRVTEVPIEPNRPIKKGDVLFKIDPAPFQFEVDSLQAKVLSDQAKLSGDEAKLAADKAKLVAEQANISNAQAALVTAEAGARELNESLAGMAGKVASTQARLELARKRLAQNRELAASGAGDRFALDQAESDVLQVQGELASAIASESEIKQKLSALVNGELSSIAGARSQLAVAKSQVVIAEAQVLVAESQLGMSKAQIELTKAQLADAKWSLEQTVYYAPANGTVVSLALRPGAVASIMVTQPVMTFVEDEQWILAIYKQNEVRKVKPEQEAEIALKTYPGRIIKCKVDSIMWATAQGQLPIGGASTSAGVAPIPPNSLAVRLLVDEKDKDLFLASGAQGGGAIYTDSGHMIHILRKVMIRVGSKLDWLILKLH
ncbi:MAG: biotin/lipoyl-binding protein [Tepidisphaeraceae bacterium]